MHPQTVLSAAVMGGDTLWELHRLRREMFPKKAVPTFLPTAEELTADVSDARLSLQKLRTEQCRLEYESAHDLFSSLSELGLNSIPGAVPLQRREILELEAAYDKKFRIPAGGIGATFSVIYLEATL